MSVIPCLSSRMASGHPKVLHHPLVRHFMLSHMIRHNTLFTCTQQLTNSQLNLSSQDHDVGHKTVSRPKMQSRSWRAWSWHIWHYIFLPTQVAKFITCFWFQCSATSVGICGWCITQHGKQKLCAPIKKMNFTCLWWGAPWQMSCSHCLVSF